MSLLDREDPRGAPERHREALLRAEKRLDAAASDAVRAFLAKARASVTPRSLTAAIGGDFPQAAHLFALGEAQGWWQEAVDENIAGEVAAAWRSGYFDTRDGDLLRSSQEAVGEYVANISDRLSRTATPTLPEAAFDKARVALSDEMARGSSTRETSQRLAAEFGWDEDARFWRGRKEELTGRIENVLDPYGPPGTPEREWQRLNNAEVRDLQRQSSEATKHIDAVQSEWQTRADRIARTETTAAYNAGSLDAGKREGAGVKVWMASADDRTRETHLDASNECVPVDDTFDVGGVPLQMPGDPSAPPEETINCRCTVLFASSCEEADEMYPVMDPERAHEQALAEDRMRTLGDETALPEQPSWDDDPFLGDTLRTAAEEPGAEVTPGGNVLTGEFQHYTDEQITDMAQMSDYLSETYGQKAVVQFDGPNPHARGGHIGELDGTGRIHLRPEAWAQSDPGTSFVGNAAEDILTHEYGHLIERKFKTSHLYDGPDLEGLFRQATQPLTDVVQRENALFEQAREAARAAGRTLGVDDLPAYREVHQAAEGVSMYGMTNRAEGFAELFLAHVSGRSNPYVDHFTEHLNEGLRQLGVR